MPLQNSGIDPKRLYNCERQGVCPNKIAPGKVRFCKKCRMAAYCSQSCLESDWEKHEDYCTRYSTLHPLENSTTMVSTKIPRSEYETLLAKWMEIHRPALDHAAIHGLSLGNSPDKGLEEFIYCIITQGPGLAAGKPRCARNAFRVELIANVPFETLKKVNPYACERLQARVEELKQRPECKRGDSMFGIVLVSLPLKNVGLEELTSTQAIIFDKLDPSSAPGKSWKQDTMWTYSVPELVRKGSPPRFVF